MEALLLSERIKNAILIGESDFREFKSAWEGKPGAKKPRLAKKISQDIGEALVAFANTDGGEIIIGIEDDGTITGVPHDERDLDLMMHAPFNWVDENQQLPMVFRQKVVIDEKLVLFFQVDKGITEIYQLKDGRVMRRNEKRQTVPANLKRLQFERNEIKSRSYDRQFVDGAQLKDLDIQLVERLTMELLHGSTPERFLQQMGVAEYTVGGLKLTRAALLLFAKDIQKWHPRCQIRILKIAGTELLSGDQYNVISDEVFQGNLFELIQKSWDYLRPYLALSTKFTSEAKFEQVFAYPEEACKEALLNAIAHRDYSAEGRGIEVMLFHDRMEIKSPGPLLSTISVEDLQALDNRHDSRNAKIAYVLKTSKVMREIGEGMKRIFTSMIENQHHQPKLYSNTVWFTLTFFQINN